MNTMQVKTHVGNDGILRLELPIGIYNLDLEVLVVMQPLATEQKDEMGYPIGYFDRTYGSQAHNPIERGEEPPLDVGDKIE